MEKLLLLLILGGLLMSLVRLMVAPIRLAWKLGINGLLGFAGLWIVNLALGFTDFSIPINAVTVLITGLFGIPGIGILAVLEMWI